MDLAHSAHVGISRLGDGADPHAFNSFIGFGFCSGWRKRAFCRALFVYVSHWYRPEDRGKAMAMLMAGAPASLILGGPLSAIFLKIHWLGLSGWRWLMLLEGLPALILGIVTLFYLTERPEQAKWLRAEERDWLIGELEREREARKSHLPAWKALGDPRVLLLGATLFLGLTATYGIGLWMPKIVEKLSASGVSRVSLVASIPYLFALPVMLLHRLALGPRGRAAMARGDSTDRGWSSAGDLRLSERARVDQHGGLIGGGGGLLRLARGLLADSHYVPGQRRGGGQHRTDQLLRESGRIPGSVYDRIPDGQNRRVRRQPGVSGGVLDRVGIANPVPAIAPGIRSGRSHATETAKQVDPSARGKPPQSRGKDRQYN